MATRKKEKGVMNYEKRNSILGKIQLTIEEAAAYFNIGVHKLRRMAYDENCPYVLWIGRKCLIKKTCLEEYLRKTYSI